MTKQTVISAGAAESVPQAAELASDLSRTRGILLTRRGLLACGPDFTVSLLTSEERLQYVGGDRWGQEACTAWRHIRAAACGPTYVLGLDRGGCVHHAGRDVQGMAAGAAALSAVRLLACGENHAAALSRDGRVVCIGDSRGGRCDTESWRNVADVCCGSRFTVGVTERGTVLCAGGSRRLRRSLRGWSGIAGVFADACGSDVYGLTGEGRLVSTARLPKAARNWSNLAQVAVSGRGLWAVTVGGSLLSRYPMPAELGSQNPLWDVVAIAAGPCHAVTVDRSGIPELLGKAVRRGRVLTEIPAGRLELGRSDVASAACLFRDFEAHCLQVERENAEAAEAETRRAAAAARAKELAGSLSCGDRITAGVDFRGHGWSTGGFDECRTWETVTRVCCGAAHVLGLRRDGSVAAAGNTAGGCCSTDSWTDIVDIQAAAYHSLGLTADGHVRFAGLDTHGQGRVSGWSDILLLRTSDTCTVGVDRAGSLYIAGACGLTGKDLTSPVWQDLADIRLSERLLVGLSHGGEVCALPLFPDKALTASLARVTTWYGVTRIAVGRAHVAALCGGGLVTAAGDDTYGQCRVGGWPGAADIVCTDNATLALLGDGTVRCAGSLPGGSTRSFSPAEADTSAPGTDRWTDVILPAAGHGHVAGLTANGHIPACGLDRDGQCSGTRSVFVRSDILPQSRRTGAVPTDVSEMLSRPAADTPASDGVEEAAGRASLLWASYAPALRREAGAWRDHLSGEGDTLYILMPEGIYSHSFAENRTTGPDTGLFRSAAENRRTMGAGALIVSPEGTLTVDGQVWTDLFSAEFSGSHTVGLRTDGTVQGAGLNDRGQCEVGDWTDIVQVLALEGETLGLCADGRILHTGRRDRILDTLRGVRAVAGFDNHQIFVMANGTLMLHTAGSEYPPTAVEGIRLFTPGVGHSILSRRGVYADCPAGALRFRRTVACGMTGSAHVCPDGTVTFTDRAGAETPALGGWRQVTAVAASGDTVFGVSGRKLAAAGTDAAVIRCADSLNRSLFTLHDDTGDRGGAARLPDSRSNADRYVAVSSAAGQIAALRGDGRVYSEALTGTPRETGGWRDVTDVSCGAHHTAAVTADGICLATGDNSCGQCEVGGPEWTNLIMVSCGEFHTAALTADGHVVAVGSNSRGQCRVEDLRDVISVTSLPEATVCVHADGRVTLRGGESGMSAWAARQHEIIAADGDELRLTLLTVDNRLISSDCPAEKRP